MEKIEWKNNVYYLLNAIEQNDINKIKSLLENDNINLNSVIYENGYIKYPLIMAIKVDIKIVELLMEYANHHYFILKLNEKINNGTYPLLMATFNNNTKIVKLLMEYGNYYNIILKLNEKDYYGYYPLLKATYHNNVELVQLLIEYANQHNIILELNERKNNDNECPILNAIINNNIEMVKLLLEYANIHNIIIGFQEININDILKINPEILELWRNYEKENGEKINIEYHKYRKKHLLGKIENFNNKKIKLTM